MIKGTNEERCEEEAAQEEAVLPDHAENREVDEGIPEPETALDIILIYTNNYYNL